MITQLPFGTMLPLENEIAASPAVGAKVGEPHPTVEAFVGVATTIFAGDVGKVSTKLMPEIVIVVGFEMVSTNVDFPPGAIVSGRKVFAMLVADGSMIVA